MRRTISYDSSPPSITYTDNDGQNTAVSVHTFATKAIGAAHPSRRVIIPLWFATTGAATCAVTVGGVAATEIAGCSLDFGQAHTRMFIADYPNGTTATVVVTIGSNAPCYIGVFSLLYALSAMPVAAVADSASPITLNLNVADRGVACGYALVNVATTWTWAGMMETFDATISGLTHSGATYTATAAQTPLSVSASIVPAGTSIGCAASFR